MILIFSKKFPFDKDRETGFKLLIDGGQKIHTIRAGSRWKHGQKIHFWDGSPRNWQHSQPFFPLPNIRNLNVEQTPEGVVISAWHPEKIRIFYPSLSWDCPAVEIKGQPITGEGVQRLAENDGLTLTDFKEWFWLATNQGKEEFVGQIIHWTRKTYLPVL